LQDPNQTVVFNHSYSMFAAFVLASIVHNFPLGQSSALQGKLISFTLIQLNDSNAMMRQWLAICLGNLWQNFEEARWSGVRDMANDKLYPLLEDPVPEVRAAAVYALGTFISSVEQRTEHANTIDRAVALQLLTTVGYDVSPLVRMELIKALQWMVIIFESSFVSIYLKEVVSGGHNGHSHQGSHFQTSSLERMKRVSSSSSIMTIDHRQSVAAAVAMGTTNMAGGGSSWLYNPSINVSVYMRFWQFFYRMSHDPYPRVARLAQKVIEHIKGQATLLIQAKEAIAAELNATGSSIRHSNPSLSVSLPPSPNTRTSYMPGGGGGGNNFVNAEVLAAKIQNSHASGKSAIRS
jgi:regulatory associated protein of mTOR